MDPHEIGRLLGEGAISQNRADDLLDRYNYAKTDRAAADEMAQLDSAFDLLHRKGDHETVLNRLRKRISDLQTRLALAVEANQALRIENAKLRAAAIVLDEMIEAMAFTIHVHEKGAIEMAATIHTRDMRIEELQRGDG